MTTTLIVLVADGDDPKRGEVTVLEGTGDAERLVEAYLEGGGEPHRVRVFAGTELEARVSHRPVVSLTTGDKGSAGSVAAEGGDDAEDDGEDASSTPEDTAAAGERQPAKGTRNGGSTLFGARTQQAVEMMPELHH